MSNQYLDKLKAQFDKLYGKGLLTSGQSLVDKPKTIIPVSPILNLHLNGGIPEGVVAIFSGREKSGKTMLALAVARNAQQTQFGERHVFFQDVEHRLKKMNLEGTQGLLIDEDHFTHTHSTPEKILTAEEWLDGTELIIKTVPNSVIIMDSSSALCAEKESINSITSSARNDGPKLLASFCRKNAAAITVNNITLIIIQHLIANTSGYGAPFQEDGGNKVKYQQDVKMRVKKSEDWKVGEKQVGQIQTWDIMTNALGALPSLATNYLRYGIGIDNVREWMELGLNFGIIEKGGAWYTFQESKFQGEEKMYQGLVNDTEMCKELILKVKEISGQ